MPTFPSKPVNGPRFNQALRKNPLLFGVPFLVIIVGSSFALSSFTQTRYDLHDQKVSQVRRLSFDPVRLFRLCFLAGVRLWGRESARSCCGGDANDVWFCDGIWLGYHMCIGDQGARARIGEG